MREEDAVLAVVRDLESAGINYMIVGSLSTNAYGVVRSTQDADFVFDPAENAISKLAAKLPPDLVLDPQMSFETVTGTSRFLLKLSKSKFKIELFVLGDDPHDQERFRRRVRGETYGQVVWLPTAEDAIITKMRWSKQGKRLKDVDDVRNVVAVQGDALDWDYIHRWCDEHGTRQLLDQIRESIPK